MPDVPGLRSSCEQEPVVIYIVLLLGAQCGFHEVEFEVSQIAIVPEVLLVRVLRHHVTQKARTWRCCLPFLLRIHCLYCQGKHVQGDCLIGLYEVSGLDPVRNALCIGEEVVKQH